MKLRTTTLFIIGMTFIGLVFVLLSSMNAILPPFFQRQEQASAVANVQRGRAALENEYNILDLAAIQLASSQAVENYRITRDPSELNTLLAANIMQDLAVNFVGVLDTGNKMMASVSLPSTYPEINVTQKDVSNIRATYLKILADRELSKEPHGLLNLESGGVLFIIHPLPPMSGSPSTQTLIIGRIIDGKLQTQISSQVLFPVNFIPLTIQQTADQYASITQDLTINSTPVTQIGNRDGWVCAAARPAW
jgi:sensor domain CHASE-containing protein